MMKLFKIPILAMTIIAEFSLGLVASYECGTRKVLILPSMNQDIQSFKCRNCKNEGSTSIKCYACIDEENLYSFDLKKHDKS